MAVVLGQAWGNRRRGTGEWDPARVAEGKLVCGEVTQEESDAIGGQRTGKLIWKISEQFYGNVFLKFVSILLKTIMNMENQSYGFVKIEKP